MRDFRNPEGGVALIHRRTPSINLLQTSDRYPVDDEHEDLLGMRLGRLIVGVRVLEGAGIDVSSSFATNQH